MKINWPKINKGDTIGVITPSRHIYGNSESIGKGIRILKKMGFEVRPGNCFKKKRVTTSGNRYERASEINEMFSDKGIKAVFSSIGGAACNQTLDLLDYETIQNNPKPIIGYSDISHLILAINARTGLITFHGPNMNLLSKLTKTSIEQLIATINGETVSKNYFSEGKTIKHGKATGTLIGGNLMVINALNRTEYSPNIDGSILFWEDIDEGISSIEYQVYQLHNSGVLGKINGMVIGHIHQPGDGSEALYKNAILELTKEYDYPIWKTSCFGHRVKKFLTFPIGARATIDTEKRTFVWG